jgi:hypothetical protein
MDSFGYVPGYDLKWYLGNLQYIQFKFPYTGRTGLARFSYRVFIGSIQALIIVKIVAIRICTANVLLSIAILYST